MCTAALQPFIGNKSMLTAKPAMWKKQRQAWTPGFAPAVGYINCIDMCHGPACMHTAL